MTHYDEIHKSGHFPQQRKNHLTCIFNSSAAAFDMNKWWVSWISDPTNCYKGNTEESWIIFDKLLGLTLLTTCFSGNVFIKKRLPLFFMWQMCCLFDRFHVPKAVIKVVAVFHRDTLVFLRDVCRRERRHTHTEGVFLALSHHCYHSVWNASVAKYTYIKQKNKRKVKVLSQFLCSIPK